MSFLLRILAVFGAGGAAILDATGEKLGPLHAIGLLSIAFALFVLSTLVPDRP